MWIDPSAQGTPLPPDIRENTEKWSVLNPGYLHKVWSIDEVFALLNMTHRAIERQAIEACRFPAMKADIARLVLLQEFGGFWADLRLRPLAAISADLWQFHTILIEHFPRLNLPDPTGVLINSFIGAQPCSPIIKTALNLVLANVATKTPRNVYSMTGPPNLENALLAYRLMESEASVGVKILSFKECWDRLWEKVEGSFNKDGMHWSLREKTEAPVDSDIGLVDVLNRPDKFIAIPGHIVSIDRIVSRQGFYPFEPNSGFCWAVAGKPSSIRFEPFVPFDGLRVKVFHAISIPLSTVHFALNGVLLNTIPHSEDEQWTTLELGPLKLKRGENELTIACERFVPANINNPNSNDSRQLSIAVAWLQPYLRR